MFAASAGGALAAGDPPADGAGGGGGGPYAGRGPSFGPRQMRICCRDSRRSTSLKSCSFISSTSRRMRSISNTSELAFGSLISGFRGFGGGLEGGGFRPGGRRERDLSASAIRAGVRSQGSGARAMMHLFHDAFLQFLHDARQHLTAPMGYQHIIFNPHAAPTRQVNARLHRNDHSCGQLSVLVGGQPRQLVNGKANAVPERVIEFLA